MRPPHNVLDWAAFVFLLVGAFAWGTFVTDVNVLDVVLERTWDPVDDLVFVLIFLSGLWCNFRVFGSRPRRRLGRRPAPTATKAADGLRNAG
jgi:hypothetical protein